MSIYQKMHSLKSKLFTVFLLALYFLVGKFLIDLPVGDDLAVAVLRIYARLGFSIDEKVLRAIMISVSFSGVIHAFLIAFHVWSQAGSKPLEVNLKIVFYYFLRASLFVFFCGLVAGAVGNNISSKNFSMFSKEISALIGGLVLGGVLWPVHDFIVVFIRHVARRFR